MKAHRLMFQKTPTPLEKTILGAATVPKTVEICVLPEHVKDPKKARKCILDHVAVHEHHSSSFPILVLAYPTKAGFDHFDSLTCFLKSAKTRKPVFVGEQMKRGEGLPSEEAPFDGVLCDKAPKSSRANQWMHWTYLHDDDYRDFIPYSLLTLIRHFGKT